MPSKVLLPIAREGYYGRQAVFVLPLLTLLWLLSATLTSVIARTWSGAYHTKTTANGMGIALGVPLLFLFLLPDLIAYAVFGFSSLRVLVRFTAPLSFIASVLLATRMTRTTHGLSTRKALVAGALGVLGQAIVGGVFLR